MEMGRFRGALITAFKWLKNYRAAEEDKLACRSYDRTVDRSFNEIDLNSI